MIDPWALIKEIEEIKKQGIEVNPENFMISESASLILPFHQEMDEIREDTAGKSKLEQQEEVLARVTRIKLVEDQSGLWI